ncbi:MAG: CpsD/CapB family tyrosine-protein kinase, partial [Candidatus Acidiferrum sp.]
AGLRSTNIVLIDPAKPTDRPAKPSVPICLIAGVFGGLLLGVGSGLFAENMDDTINTADDVERITMLPSLGMIPMWKEARKLPAKSRAVAPSRHGGIFVISQSRSQPAEAFRAVRTAISQSIRSGVTTVILMTSALPGEGKTTVGLNCAAAFAQQGSRVLLVEADLRRPRLASQLGLSGAKGLTSLIKGESCPELPIKLSDIPYLSVVPAGPLPTYPAELLGSNRMKELVNQWRGEYDYIVFDTPPVLSVTDAVVLTSSCDCAVLVAKARTTQKQALSRARDLFRNARTRVLGVILNGLDSDSPDYAAYYGYKNNLELGDGYYKPISR